MIAVVRTAFILLIFSLTLALPTIAQTDEGPPSGTISGQVINENGQPVANATVFLRGSAPMFQPRTAGTDSEGRFQVAGLDPLLYGVSVAAPSYTMPPRDPDSPPVYYRVGENITITVIKGGVITGTVLNTNGDPVVQIGVRAVMIRDSRGEAPRFIAFQQQRATDDRGIYRLYGLTPGTYLVSTTTRPAYPEPMSAYDGEAPTFSPSATRDTAAEITVRSGEETTADIRYRGDPGRTVSGKVIGLSDLQTPVPIGVQLLQTTSGVSMSVASSFQRAAAGGDGFAFHGVADGEYDVVAQHFSGQTDAAVSEPRHIVVKGGDVTGIELALKPLGWIEGRVALVKSEAPECKDKRRPSFSETLISVRQNDKIRPKDQPRPTAFFFAQGTPNEAGDFKLRNLTAGKYDVNTRFFARYWYLQSITPGAPVATAKSAPVRRPDVSRDGITLRMSERVKDLTITLAEGAGSLRGKIMRDAGTPLPPNIAVHLVPAEKESAEDSLRYFAAPVQPDGSFALNNLPPGTYWVVARTSISNTSLDSNAAETLAQLRRSAEATKNTLEFKPCQNVTNFSLPLP